MSNSGWNYNLTKRCVKTTKPSEPTYYEDTQQCGPGFPGQVKNWTLGISSENGDTGAVCPQPSGQSFLINAGPITLGWLPHTDEFGNANWSVNLKTNFHDFTHPCGGNHFNWYMFMDHIGNYGGPLPTPDKLQFSATVNYNDFCPNGAVRGLAMFQGHWAGKDRMLELHFQSTNWGDNEPGNPIVVSRREDAGFQYIALHGQYFGITVPKLQDTLLTVDWRGIINTLVSVGYLPALDAGAVTQAVGIGHETHNWTADLAAVADMWFTNFRISEI